MIDEIKIACCTGRFQIIHYGHVQFLKKVIEISNKQHRNVYVLTGPLDRQIKGDDKVPFLFRKILISTLFGIKEQNILSQYGSPHVNERQTRIWLERFFEAFDNNLQGKQVDCTKTDIAIIAVKKKKDFKIYLSSRSECHYLDLVRERHCSRILKIIDITNQINSRTRSISSSLIAGKNAEKRRNYLPAASYAASLIIKSGRFESQRFRKKIVEIHEQYGFGNYNVCDIEAIL